jgi:hypothetical protein
VTSNKIVREREIDYRVGMKTGAYAGFLLAGLAVILSCRREEADGQIRSGTKKNRPGNGSSEEERRGISAEDRPPPRDDSAATARLQEILLGDRKLLPAEAFAVMGVYEAEVGSAWRAAKSHIQAGETRFEVECDAGKIAFGFMEPSEDDEQEPKRAGYYLLGETIEGFATGDWVNGKLCHVTFTLGNFNASTASKLPLDEVWPVDGQ